MSGDVTVWCDLCDLWQKSVLVVVDNDKGVLVTVSDSEGYSWL